MRRSLAGETRGHFVILLGWGGTWSSAITTHAGNKGFAILRLPDSITGDLVALFFGDEIIAFSLRIGSQLGHWRNALTVIHG